LLFCGSSLPALVVDQDFSLELLLSTLIVLGKNVPENKPDTEKRRAGRHRNGGGIFLSVRNQL
jgi:hypothetical protein